MAKANDSISSTGKLNDAARRSRGGTASALLIFLGLLIIGAGWPTPAWAGDSQPTPSALVQLADDTPDSVVNPPPARAPQSSPAARSFQIYSSLFLSAGIGFVLLLLALYLAGRAVVRNYRSPELWLGVVLGGGIATHWLRQAWAATYRHSDETTDFLATVAAAFSHFDPLDRAYPAFYAILTGTLHSLAIVGRALFTELTIERATAITLLFDMPVLLFVARLVSTLSCLGALVLIYRITTALSGARWVGLLPVAFIATYTNFMPWPFWASPHPLALFLGLLFIYLTALQGPARPMTPSRAAAMGLLFGAAVATHLFALFLGPVFLVPLIHRQDRFSPARSLFTFVVTFALFFMLLNYPMFIRPTGYLHYWGQHFLQLFGEDFRPVLGLLLMAAMALALVLTILAVRLIRTHWRHMNPALLAILFPLALYLAVFATAEKVMPWYHVYPMALAAILLTTIVVRVLRLQRHLWLAGRVLLLAATIFIAQRPTEIPPHKFTTDICFEGTSRGATLVQYLLETKDTPGVVGVYDNSFHGFEKGVRLGLFGGWLAGAVHKEILRRTERETVWLYHSIAAQSITELGDNLSAIFRIKWTASTDMFEVEWTEGFELVYEATEGDCILQVYHRE